VQFGFHQKIVEDPVSTFRRGVSNLLNARTPRKVEHRHRGRAAVLMPIFQKQKEYFFLLTKRTEKVETHKGQISFPGGVTVTADEPLSQTALRETWEEIGLAPERIQLLGELDEYFSVTGLIVTPFVGWIEPLFELTPNPDEVEEILQVPLNLFRDSTHLRIEIRRKFDQDLPVYFYNYQGRDVWGLTAQIIRDFMMLIDEPLSAISRVP
jgi:8-oxo-dGTP pyrophosphatase MutT (NUDIX family)